MTDNLFTLADCDRHDELRTKEGPHNEAVYESAAICADIRQCATIRALAAALAEQVTHCERCDGQGDIISNVHMRDDGVFDCDTPPCPDCKPARDLLAKMGVKL